MTKRPDKLKLAVIFHGARSQTATNLQQFKFLSSKLAGFVLKKYAFTKQSQKLLLRDYKSGGVDLVLKNSYGRGNECDIELFLEKHGIPFLGSGSRATLIGTSKKLSKLLFRKHGLPVAPDVGVDRKSWVVRSKNKILSKITKNLGYPCILKDTAGTDSRGIYLVKNSAELKRKLDNLVSKNNAFIVEKYIQFDNEVTCAVAGKKNTHAYEPVEFANKRGMFSAREKDSGNFVSLVPARIPKRLRERIQRISRLAHELLCCRSFSRADILIKGKQIYLLEVDVHPGFRDVSATTKSIEYEKESLNSFFLKLSAEALKGN